MLKSRHDVLTQTLLTVTTYRCVSIHTMYKSKLVVRVKNNFISKPVFISFSNDRPTSRFLEAWRSAFSSVRPCKYRIFLQLYNTLYTASYHHGFITRAFRSSHRRSENSHEETDRRRTTGTVRPLQTSHGRRQRHQQTRYV